MNYLVLGNSAAACATVDGIRTQDKEGTITMVSPEPYDAYGTPLISYILKGSVDADNVFIRTPEWYEDNKVVKVFGEGKGAAKIDPKGQVVTLQDGTELPYDKLCVATGSVPFTPPLEGLPEDAPNRFTFLTMDAALSVKEHIDQIAEAKAAKGEPTRAIVIGGGLIGAKAAEGLCYHCDEVTILELGPRILQAVLDDDASAILQKLLRKHGITPMSGVTASKVKVADDGKTIVGCELTNGDYLDCDLLVTAVGVRPNSSLLVEAGAEEGRGIICDEYMQTSLPNIYAAGDLTSVHNTLTGADAPLALWPNANEQGRVAGMAMAGYTELTYDGSFAVNAVGFFDEMDILTCGVINPPEDDDSYEVRIRTDGDVYTKFVTKDDALQGYILMNRPQGAGIYTNVVRQGIPLSKMTDEIFTRPIEELDMPKEYRAAHMRKGYVERSAS